MYVQIRTSVREREQWNLFVRTFDRAALISGAGRTEPLPNRDPDNNGPNTEHVEALIAFIAEKNLVVFLTGAALFTYQLPAACAEEEEEENRNGNGGERKNGQIGSGRCCRIFGVTLCVRGDGLLGTRAGTLVCGFSGCLGLSSRLVWVMERYDKHEAFLILVVRSDQNYFQSISGNYINGVLGWV
nr:hypothetical protein VITISV_021030 [Ipomoea trifida]